MFDTHRRTGVRWSSTLAGALALLATCKIFAAMPLEPMVLAQAGEAEFFSDLPVVLSVTRLPQAMKDVPGFVSVIDAEMIRHSGARDLAELLRGVPGFQVAINSYGAPLAGYHGMTNDYPKGLQVLIDGRTQHSPLFQGAVGWNIIDVSLADIERIEVLRGSNSPVYGSNAFLGVVNIVTRHPTETRGVVVSGSEGNYGIRDRYARLGFGQGIWSARLSAEKNQDEGIAGFFDSRMTERYNLRVDADPGPADSFRVSAGLVRVDLELGYPPDAATDPVRTLTDPHRVADADSVYGKIDWRHQWSESSITDIRLFRIRQSSIDNVQVVLPPFFTEIRYTGVAIRDEFEVRQTLLTDAWRITGGLTLRQDEVNHDYYYGIGRTVRQEVERAFGQIEWRPNSYITANLGASYEDDSISGSSFSPRGAINLHATPGQTFKFIIGKSRRNPTLSESRGDQRLYQTVDNAVPVNTLLNVELSSTGNIKAEEVLSKEFGYFGELKSYRLTLDARVFREDVSNRLEPFGTPITTGTCPLFEQAQGAPCGDYQDYYNVIDARVAGWETQIAWQPTRTTFVGASFADVKIDANWSSTTRPFDSSSNSFIRYMNNSSPRHSWSVWGRQRVLERITLAAAYYDVDSFSWTQNGKTNAYHRFDWRIAYDFRLGPVKGELAWTVRNDGSDHAEWRSSRWDGVTTSTVPELIGTRQFASLHLEY